MPSSIQNWILHLDMDAFFASVEQLDDPSLRGKPLIIGAAERGVVSTASYEARKYGIHSAMPVFQARKLCPQGVFIRGRGWRYKEKSREVMRILERFSPLVEPASIDEAYLDISGLERIYGTVDDIGRKVQRAIVEGTGLTCSIGIAPVKFLAKIASDLKKPAGLTVLRPEEISAFLENLPVGKIPGVGKHTLSSLETLGIRTCGDVLRFPLEYWTRKMGKAGEHLFRRSSGLDSRSVQPYVDPKSEGAENTFPKDILDVEELCAWLLRQSERVGTSLRAHNLQGRTITLKIKFADFTQKTRSRTLKEPTNLTRVIYSTAVQLLKEARIERPLRLIGVSVSQFGQEERQLSLLACQEGLDLEKEAALDATLDSLRCRYGTETIIRGKLFKK